MGLLLTSTEAQVPFPQATKKKPTEVSSPSMGIGSGHRAGSQKADQGTHDLTGGNALWAGLLLAARLPKATNRHPALRSASPGDPGRGTCVLSETGSESVPEQLRKSSGRRSEQQNKANLSVQETQSDQAPGPVARAAL